MKAKDVVQALLVILLGVPMMVVGYFGTYLVFGVVTGHRLYMQWHKPGEESTKTDSNKTSP